MKGIVINAKISDKFSNGQQTVSFKIDYLFGNWSWLFEKVQVKYVLNMCWITGCSLQVDQKIFLKLKINVS